MSTLGKGKLYFDEFVSGTETPQGEFYIAQTPDFNANVSTEVLKDYDEDEGVKVLTESIPISTDRTFSFSAKEITDELVSMFIMGDLSSFSQAATPVIDEEITVKPNRWYQLGKTDINPQGVRNVASVEIEDETDTTTYVEGTDYEIDLVLGRFKVLSAGSIADGDVLHVDYTPAAETRSRIVATAGKVISGTLRFISTNPTADYKDWYCTKVNITPNGDFALKGSEWQQCAFSVEVLGSIYIDGRAAA